MKRDFTEQKRRLPEFPSTPHLPWKCAGKGVQVTEQEAAVLWTSHVVVEEKIDGASVGMTIDDDENPIIRNRDFVLVKGYGKDTPAKNQFKPIWNWWYSNRDKFKELRCLGQYSVYGEWMYMAHGIQYDLLPSLFVTYELYDYEQGFFVEPEYARHILWKIGFEVISPVHIGQLDNWEQLEEMANGHSVYATGTKREGIYLKIGDGKQITHRFKMVREDFVQGALFSDTIIKNKLSK